MSTLTAGTDLTRGASQQSANGRYTLTLQDDGNLVLSEGGQPVWASGTNGSGADRLAVQEDGNVVLYAGGDAKWATGTQGNQGVRLELQDDRNLVVYGNDGRALWASNTAVPSAQQSAPAETAPAPAPAEPAPAPAPAEVAPAAPAAPAQQEYVVESGDTLSAIAERYYGDASAYMKIAEANGISNPDFIEVGQRLIIPA